MRLNDLFNNDNFKNIFESYCEPINLNKYLKVPDTYVSSIMMDRAVEAIKAKAGPIDRTHDIPYLAGYSIDGKKIYIDRHLPMTFKFKGRDVPVDRYLLLHEEVEKSLIDHLNLHYQHAHQIATRAEEAAVRADKISWRDYNRFMQKYIKTAGDERLVNVPDDLDLKPYRDEHDYDLLKRMQRSISNHDYRLNDNSISNQNINDVIKIFKNRKKIKTQFKI